MSDFYEMYCTHNHNIRTQCSIQLCCAIFKGMFAKQCCLIFAFFSRKSSNFIVVRRYTINVAMEQLFWCGSWICEAAKSCENKYFFCKYPIQFYYYHQTGYWVLQVDKRSWNAEFFYITQHLLNISYFTIFSSNLNKKF